MTIYFLFYTILYLTTFTLQYSSLNAATLILRHFSTTKSLLYIIQVLVKIIYLIIYTTET